ncbi:Response regulatory domain-containing protein [Vibrio chagasii]|nr:Response regulatory domain-containing protein [Vibrio chagasii]CAH7438045.1 Response regulatory domain-containing protein [Vibrio chagasii]
MKILIADDNENRAKSIERLILDEFGLDKSSVHIELTSEGTLANLRRNKYDVLIIDVVFKKLGEDPSCETSYEILDKISNKPKYNKPNKVIGITAFYEDITSYREEFDKYCFCLIEASNKNKNWKMSILKALDYEIKKFDKEDDRNKTLCLTVHGIRTKGVWQDLLKNSISKNVGDIKLWPYDYGYFDVVSFFIPILRFFSTHFFKKKLKACLDENRDKNIYIFCHSFGTYLVVKSLNSLLKKSEYKNIKKIVLSGSVLKSNFNFNKILDGTDASIINDCGESDYILTASQIFVPNMGMAGKVGFRGFNDDRIVNRFFDGGHSHYFDKDSKFIEKYWIPLFFSSKPVERINKTTKDSYFNSLLDVFSRAVGSVKELIYIALIYMIAINYL